MCLLLSTLNPSLAPECRVQESTQATLKVPKLAPFNNNCNQLCPAIPSRRYALIVSRNPRRFDNCRFKTSRAVSPRRESGREPAKEEADRQMDEAVRAVEYSVGDAGRFTGGSPRRRASLCGFLGFHRYY